jgi:polyhydroxyalkanoate synthase
VVLRDGSARLLRLTPREVGETSPSPRRGEGRGGGLPPVLLVPSLINRWYVLDLCPQASLAAALAGAGLEVYCLDWGVPGDEDRFLEWDDVLGRLWRALRVVRRRGRTSHVSLLGYCLGGTLAAITAALDPSIGALVNLAGPIDFEKGGMLTHLTSPRWFDADAIAAAGNPSAWMLQSGFVALRPTLELKKRLRAFDPADTRTEALEAWAADNVPFPAAAYARYVRELYQENALVRGTHRVAGRLVDLGAIRCPVLTVVADGDTICPPKAALALHERCTSADVRALTIPGGHVGAVVGKKSAATLYPALAAFFGARPRRDHRDTDCLVP